MSAKKLYERKPDAETVARKVSRNFALQKVGIDPRTEDKKRDDADRTRQVKHWRDKTGGEV